MRYCLFVLIAVLSCSCDSPVNKAQLQIESNALLAAHDEHGRGEEMRMTLKEMAEDKSVPEKQHRAVAALASIKKIDQAAAACIAEMEELKLDLLKDLGVYLKFQGTKNSVISRPYDKGKYPLDPASVRLEKITNSASTDLIAYSSERGERIRQLVNDYRKVLCENLVSSRKDDNVYHFKYPATTSTGKELEKIIRTNSKVHDEDLPDLISCYSRLSNTDETWKQLLPESCSWITAFGILTSLETTILQTRADVVALIESRNYKSFYFDKILPVAAGPEAVKMGEETTFPVFMAAFNSKQDPAVECAGGQVVHPGSGMASIRVPANVPCEMVVEGKIAIKDRRGKPHTRSWSKKIVVTK